MRQTQFAHCYDVRAAPEHQRHTHTRTREQQPTKNPGGTKTAFRARTGVGAINDGAVAESHFAPKHIVRHKAVSPPSVCSLPVRHACEDLMSHLSYAGACECVRARAGTARNPGMKCHASQTSSRLCSHSGRPSGPRRMQMRPAHRRLYARTLVQDIPRWGRCAMRDAELCGWHWRWQHNAFRQVALCVVIYFRRVRCVRANEFGIVCCAAVRGRFMAGAFKRIIVM